MKTQWNEISTQLQIEFDRNIYNVWLAPLEGSIDYTNPSKAILTILANSSYVADWIQQKYLHKILSIVTRMLKTDVQIKVKVKEKNTNYTPKNIVTQLPTAPAIIASEQPLPVEMPIVNINIQKQEKTIQSWKNNFENFTVGQSNQLAYAAAKEIISPNASTEMLFLSSATGLGKTHLAQALAKAMLEQSKVNNLSIAYLNSETFTSQFIQASQYKTLDTFKKRFQSLDLLLLEDVHFLHGKTKTQEELLNIVKHLQNEGKKVVFTSSFAPRELKDLDSSLTSRFCSGFLASIDYPDFDMKKAMLMQKAKLRNFILPEPVAEVFAKQLQGDIRVLESSLNTLMLHAKVSNKPLTPDVAYSILAQIAPQNAQLSLEELLSLVCSCYGITEEQMRSVSRKQNFVTARNTAYYLIRKHFPFTLADIGTHFAKKHSTVSKGITLVESELTKKSRIGTQFQQAIDAIEARFAL